MSDNFDLAELTKDLSADEAMEFISSTLTQDAVQKFKSKKKQTSLQANYEAEIAAIPSNSPHYTKIQKVSAIKAKYRRAGLEVY